MSLAGKVALCVGSISGIGKAIACRLAELNANVIVVGRNKDAGKDLVKQLKFINTKGSYDMIQCDATSMSAIAASCTEFETKFDRLDFCILSQGIATLSGRNETPEGIDEKLASHYYGRIMFIIKLDNILRKTAASNDVRVLNILSGGIHSPYSHLDDLAVKNNYSLTNAANAAGFYNDLAMDAIARDFKQSNIPNISFIHAAPGFVRTTWGKDFHPFLRAPLRLLQRFGMTPEKCADNMVNNALLGKHMGPAYDGATFHLMTEKGIEAKRTTLHNDIYRNAVWAHTNEVLANAVSIR